MRWEAKKYPKAGDTRQRIGFAWLPITIDETVVWFESYIANETYLYNNGTAPPRWIKTSVELIKHDGMW